MQAWKRRAVLAPLVVALPAVLLTVGAAHLNGGFAPTIWPLGGLVLLALLAGALATGPASALFRQVAVPVLLAAEVFADLLDAHEP